MSSERPSRRPAVVRSAAIAVAAVLLAAGCGSDAASSSSSDAPDGTLDVVASFYPLQVVAEQVGGGLVSVTNITPAGAEPHDLELTARDTATLQESDLVVFLGGFAPALDDGIATVGATALDVAAAADLDLTGTDDHDGDEPA
ncbi:MAG: zinc ABC transporter substrate-binding protein, partial [Ilumatobacteraceae bacterium]